MSKKLIQISISLLILISAVVISIYIIKTKPKIKSEKPSKLIPLVRVKKVKYKPYRIVVEIDGSVKTWEETSLVPQVSGKIVYISPNLREGGCFKKGELLVKIEDKDYRLAIKKAEAQVKQAESELIKLEAEAKQAIEEWKSIRKEPPPLLVAKEPQIKAAEAKLLAAKAELEKAELNFLRTNIYAPFSGCTISKMVGRGQFVSPPQVIAKIYSTEKMEVICYTIPENVKWIKKGYKSEIISDLQNKPIKGIVIGLGGEIDKKTGLVPVIIEVKTNKNHLLPKDYVKVRIKGPILKKAVVLPVGALHHDEKGRTIVWTVDKNGKLRFKKVSIIYLRKDQAIISKGLKNGDLVILSPLSIVSEGMKVKVKP